MRTLLITSLILFSHTCFGQLIKDEIILIETSEGNITIHLDAKRAPITVDNFIDLIESDYFDGSIFHRVIENFMIQGGGFDSELNDLESLETIPNESGNGLSNLRGTIAMARTSDPHSANAQFFINTKDNRSLNPKSGRWGYAVFGSVIDGMDIVDKISKKRTGPKGRFMDDVPIETVLIKNISIE
tara:strand:- start:164 stop:721 length:558 start_codon:yes stop_codon:yes gene_type:complete